jgi:hypothetical protein
VFVDHEEVEPVPIEVVSPMLLLSQTPSEVEIQYFEEDVPKHNSQPTEQPTVQPAEQSAVQPAHSLLYSKRSSLLYSQHSSLMCSHHSSLP